MSLFSDLDTDSTATSCRRHRRSRISSNNIRMGGRGRGRGRGGVRGGEGGGSPPGPPPGPPPRTRTLEERVEVLERRINNLTFAWKVTSEEGTKIRQDALMCLGEIRVMNRELLAEVRRLQEPHPIQPPRW